VQEREQRVWAAGLLVARRAPAVHCAPCTYGASGKPGGNKAAARGEGGKQRGLISRGGEKSGRIRSDPIGARRPATRLPLGARARRRRALVVQAGRQAGMSKRSARGRRARAALRAPSCLWHVGPVPVPLASIDHGGGGPGAPANQQWQWHVTPAAAQRGLLPSSSSVATFH
jgi:hypothetical protein